MFKIRHKAYCPVDEKGLLTAETGLELSGKFVLDANKDLTQLLDQKGRLLKSEFITHSYPHDERLKKPVILELLFNGLPQFLD